MNEMTDNVTNVNNETAAEAAAAIQEAVQSSGLDWKPVALGGAAGVGLMLIAKPATRFVVKGARKVWSKTGAKLFKKPADQKPADDQAAGSNKDQENSDNKNQENLDNKTPTE